MALTKHEMELVLAFLQELGGNASCNDFEMEDTKENRKLLVMAHTSNTHYQWSPDDWDFQHYLTPHNGHLRTSDFIISGYLETRLQEEIDSFK